MNGWILTPKALHLGLWTRETVRCSLSLGHIASRVVLRASASLRVKSRRKPARTRTPERKRLRRHAQIAEVRDRLGVDPQRDRAPPLLARLDVVDDQCRLRLAVHEQPRLAAANFDPDLRPRVG